ncbi:NRDE family protein [Siminovitchia sp. FSL H7-0308]|uniref:NRDE family protein n=1 Tax=Siminovitchia sp. FSL H7-0308 TaxID=2921432 RepID=UPI0030ECC84D
MCIIFAAYKSHPDFNLIVAANRDEFYSRKAAPAHFWKDDPNILAGRDLEQMGTWMGVTLSGRFAALTNYRDPNEEQANKQSRGHIVRDFLSGSEEPEHFLDSLQSKKKNFRGFNLLVGNQSSLMYYSNIENKAKALRPGVYGLSNHLLNSPWPKVEKGKASMLKLIAEKTIDHEKLFEILRDDEPALEDELPKTGVPLDLEKTLSSIFIRSPHYGTRCSTVLTVSKKGEVQLIERTYSNPSEHERRFQFKINEFS